MLMCTPGSRDADEFMTKRLLIPVLEERRDWSPTVETSSLLPIGDMDVSSASIESEVKVIVVGREGSLSSAEKWVPLRLEKSTVSMYIKVHSSLRCLCSSHFFYSVIRKKRG